MKTFTKTDSYLRPRATRPCSTVASRPFAGPVAAWLTSGGLLLSVASCGGSDSGIDTRVTSSVPASRSISELSAAELNTFCRDISGDVRNFFGAIRESLEPKNICTVIAAIGTTTEASCNSVRDICISEGAGEDAEAFADLPGDDDEDFFDCDEGEFAEGAAECPNVNVGDMLACFNEFLDEVRASFRSTTSLTCADAPRADAASFGDFGLIFDSFGTSATCQRVAADCPSLFDDEDDDDDDFEDFEDFAFPDFSPVAE